MLWSKTSLQKSEVSDNPVGISMQFTNSSLDRRPAVLDNVYIRPAMEGKRVPGKVEIHQNGIRYQSPLNAQHRVDILFSNVKHLFFQPCQHELIVIIHIHLKDPIIV